jgi:hypothetical protein
MKQELMCIQYTVAPTIVTCTTTDNVGNAASTPVSYSVQYASPGSRSLRSEARVVMSRKASTTRSSPMRVGTVREPFPSQSEYQLPLR